MILWLLIWRPNAVTNGIPAAAIVENRYRSKLYCIIIMLTVIRHLFCHIKQLLIVIVDLQRFYLFTADSYALEIAREI